MMIRIHSDSYKDGSLNGASTLVPDEIGYAVDILDTNNIYGEIILSYLLKKLGWQIEV